MKKFNKLISLLLTVLMLLGSFATVLALGVFSASADDTVAGTETGETASGSEAETGSNKVGDIDYINDVFLSPDAKLASMKLAVTKDGYELYVDSYSGEVAIKNLNTGEILFTNPYDIAVSTGNDETKKEILSQIIVTFTDNTGIERVFTSYEEAADRGQIVIEAIKGGVRVEYTIGRESSKVLVPRLISYERFEEMILAPLYETFGEELYDPRPQNPEIFDVQKMLSYYMIYSKEKLDIPSAERRKMDNIYGGLYDDLINSDAQYARALKKFPIIETLPVFAFDPDASEAELTKAEEMITKYCPEYTYEELEYDHLLTDYKATDKNPPVFRMALEYTIEKDGLSVRLPANGIRFNESLYTLTNLQVLPYMGAGSGAYEGYNFFPDGSGTLFDFQELNTNRTYSVSGKVYGTDFAYHEITETYQKTIRYPVFGIVEDTTYYSYKEYDADGNFIRETILPGAIVDALKAYAEDEAPKACSGKLETLKKAWIEAFGIAMGEDDSLADFKPVLEPSNTVITEITDKKGFVAVIEEGDALASLTTYHAGALNDYNTVKMQFIPRPQDSYNLSDSISVGSDTEWTVVSDRKYVGNYKIKYILLSDAQPTEPETPVYDTSWFGMAVAYRDYLTNKGIIAKQTSTYKDIPLYIETFGAIETTERILSIPVDVMAPLTTFENVEQIYNELAAQGMKNINFKLTGYANGGMQYTMPGNLKFERAVGGNKGFQALLDAASAVNKADKNSHFGIFPDFDFAYSANSKIFDVYNEYFHNAKTIDGRYASKRVYSATQQKYVNYYEMVISPAYFSEFYEKLAGNYFGKYTNINGISLSTLGGALNSDFDEDEPYNREDSKEFTIEAFEYFNTNYKNAEIMTDDGNAYVWKYADHILGVALDSSRYNSSSKAVPFIGVVLHGSKSFAGEPLNMEGDINYAILKAIENGASPYFILSFQNTDVLKKDEQLSKYYSIRYDIWADDIIDVYSKLNNAIGDVQDKYITGHAFFEGYRIPDSDELKNDVLAEYLKNLEDHRNMLELAEKELREAVKIARENGRNAEAYAAQAILEAIKQYDNQMDNANNSIGFDNFDGDTYYANMTKAYEGYLAAVTKVDQNKYSTVRDIVADFNKSFEECVASYDALMAKYVINENAEAYESLYDDLYDVYDDYGNGKINKAQFEAAKSMLCASFALDNAIEDYKNGKIALSEFTAALGKYAASKVDTGDLDDVIAAYVDGETNKSAKTDISDAKRAEDKAAFDKAVANYISLDESVKSAISKWLAGPDGTAVAEADVIMALNAYVANDTTKNKRALDEKIGIYVLQNTDETVLSVYVQAFIDAKDELKAAEGVWDDAKGKLKYTSKLSDEKFNEAQLTYDAAVVAFEEAMNVYYNGGNSTDFNNAIKAFDSAKSAYQTAVEQHSFDETVSETEAKTAYYEAYKQLAKAQANVSLFFVNNMIVPADLNIAYTAYSAALEAYFINRATESAYDIVIESGFNLDFDTCFAKYLAFERTNLMSKWGKMVTQGAPKTTEYTKYTAYLMMMDEAVSLGIKSVDSNDTMDKDKFTTYHAASGVVTELEEGVDSFKTSLGSYEIYIDACAKLAAMEKLGYDKAAEGSKQLEDYNRAVLDKSIKRNNAIKTLALIDSNSLSSITDIYKTADEYYKLAVEAIGILELSELKPLEMSIKYELGREGDITAITNYDEIADVSFIVKQAIDRALAVNNYVIMDKYNEITYGQPALDNNGAQRYHNGEKLYTVIDDSGKRLYFTGTLETGYTYYTQETNGNLTIYRISDNFIVTSNTGAAIYKYTLNGESFYYSVGTDSYTYYDNFGTDRAPVCIVRPDTVYDLSDEPVAYIDDDGNDIGNISGSVAVYTTMIGGKPGYVSVDENGVYTRYTYNRAISNCYEASVEVMEDVKSVVSQDSTFDTTFYEDLEERIELFKQMQSKDDEEQEQETEDENAKYIVENIVAVTYGNQDGSAYKTILLNYNNYTVRVSYEYNGVSYEYNIPAYEYVVIKH